MNLQHFFNDVIAKGGASYNLTTGEYNPTSGYFVSLPNFEQKIPLSEFTQQSVKDYINKNSIEFTNEFSFLGGWIDKKTVYLDVSRQYNDKRFALNLVVNGGQMAVYDAYNGVNIELPTPQRAGTMQQNRSYMTFKINELCKL